MVFPYRQEKYINVDIANQLSIFESNIVEKKNMYGKMEYEIKNLEVKIDDYKYISQFDVRS